ncbi:MAG: AAA family ATPase, partial [Planctomycetia bacterium]
NNTTGEFTFKKGPLFKHVVLADEINRTSPRTQSALLEAMNDGQVSVDGSTYPLPPPFIVLATQNPFEFEGTYPLPESQLDRFMLRITVGYPPREEEHRLLANHRDGEPVVDMKSVVTVGDVLRMQHAARHVEFERSVVDYLLDVIHATREHPELIVGASTRGALLLYRAAQALALLRGRTFVAPDDVKEMAVPVLSHRVVARGLTPSGGRAAVESIIAGILQRTAVPA